MINVAVDYAGDSAQILGEPGSQGVGLLRIRTDHTHVDRSRLPEVQHLIDDVGGLKEELAIRKPLGQFAPQVGHVSGGWRVILVQGDQHLAVHGSHGGGIADGHVHAAVRQADVVQNGFDLIIADDLTDRLLDPGEILGRDLDTRPRGCANV